MVTIIFSCLLILLSLTINVHSQTCHGMYQYNPCSTNSECGCLPYSFSGNFGICGLLSSNCSQFTPCQSPYDACPHQHVCVRHTRCDTRPLCYPMSMAQQSVCPPIATITSTRAPLTTITYSETFTSGVNPTAQCQTWKTFFANLSAQDYTLLKMYGTNDTDGVSLHDPTIISNIIQALKNSTPYGPVTSNGATWTVGLCGSGYELVAKGTFCQCHTPAYSVRPCIANANYGGIGTTNCNGPTQTMNVMLQY